MVFAESIGGADVVRVASETPEATLEEVRSAVAAGDAVLVSPDEFFEVDGKIDHDKWLAFAATLVVDGVFAIETTLVKDARRLFVTHSAIVGAGAEK